jgi:hypothetical protein
MLEQIKKQVEVVILLGQDRLLLTLPGPYECYRLIVLLAGAVKELTLEVQQLRQLLGNKEETGGLCNAAQPSEGTVPQGG